MAKLFYNGWLQKVKLTTNSTVTMRESTPDSENAWRIVDSTRFHSNMKPYVIKEKKIMTNKKVLMRSDRIGETLCRVFFFINSIPIRSLALL